MRTTLPFEVLSQPIVPNVPDIPYVQQGFFVQVSNGDSSPNGIQIGFNPSPAFQATSTDGKIVLMVNYIDPDGNVNPINAEAFAAQPISLPITLNAFQTAIFGVQYILLPGSSTKLVGSTPQEGAAARGFVDIVSTLSIYPLGTARQVFTNFNADGSVANLSEAAYAVGVVEVSNDAELRSR